MNRLIVTVPPSKLIVRDLHLVLTGAHRPFVMPLDKVFISGLRYFNKQYLIPNIPGYVDCCDDIIINVLIQLEDKKVILDYDLFARVIIQRETMINIINQLPEM